MQRLRVAIVAAAAVMLSWQLFFPPIVGLADQGDFGRMIGRFGFSAADKTAEYAFVARKYVPDPNSRVWAYEQASSEYIFVGAATLLNKVLSKDGTLDITIVGFIHMLAFLYAFYRLLLRVGPLLSIVALLILTDVGYVAYWNSFYAEPASCIFFLLLLGESIAMCGTEVISNTQVVRWTLWAVLFILAKPQNAPLGILLALLAFRLRGWSKSAVASALLIVAAISFNMLTVPVPTMWSSTYDQVFMAILPESKAPADDAQALGLTPDWLKYSGTGAWTEGTAFPEAVKSGVIGKTITHGSIIRFYLLRPARIWRHAKRMLPVAFSLRPEWCGNFERSAGLPRLAKSSAFTMWSEFREHVLAACGKFVVLALLLCPILCVAAWVRSVRDVRLPLEFFGVLTVCCLLSFGIAVCGDAWDNVKHLFLFNVLLDAWLVAGVAFLFQYGRKVLHGI
jgi:hypothetical protein